MASSGSSSTFLLHVKEPNGEHGNHTLEVSFEWTVFMVKKHLEANFPGFPPVSDQKIIYAGRILTDAQLLRDVLFRVDFDTPQTFFLVLKSQSNMETLPHKKKMLQLKEKMRTGCFGQLPLNDSPAQCSSSTSVVEVQKLSSQTTSPSNSQDPETPLESSLGTSSLPSNSAENTSTPPLQASFPSGFQTLNFSQNPNSAFLIYQHDGNTYALPVSMCDARFSPPQHASSFPPHISTSQPPSTTSANPPPAPAASPPPAPPAAPLHANRNAAALGELLEEEVDNGMMSKFWILLKLSFLVYILGQNLSWERLVTLSFTALVVFFYECGFFEWFFPNRGPLARVAAPLHENEPLPNPQNDPVAPGEAEGQGAHQDPSVQEEQVRDERSLWSELKLVFFTFVESLIPNRPLRGRDRRPLPQN